MKKYGYLCNWLIMAGWLTACTSADTALEENQYSQNFKVMAQTSTTLPPTIPNNETQYTKLYIAERLQEHTEALHCAPEHRYTLTNGQFDLSQLFGQWYKFAFVCVPQWANGGGEQLLGEENPVDKTCDFTKLLIKFNQVLQYQKNNSNIAAIKDLNIYRKLIDRWINPDTKHQEDVVMSRITGELFIDMGIPADQFSVPLKSIVLSIKNPYSQVYIHDNAQGKLIMRRTGVDWIYERDFSTLKEAEFSTAMETKQTFHLCLLPETLIGSLTVNFKGNLPGGANALVMDLGTSKKQHRVDIRSNQVTKVLYNGMEKNEFEIRYAGFDDKAQIDVDKDEWNGWNP